VAYFLGKSLISAAGAYLGQRAALTIENLLSTNEYILFSAVLSIVLVVVLIKLDLSAIAIKLGRAVRKS
jgi:hypothetical protein